MSAFDSAYDFIWATVDDIDNIMRFIKNQWKSETILATSKDCFSFQYQNDKTINFILAINKKTGEIESISGFVQYSKDLLDIGPAVWLSKTKTEMPFLGVATMRKMLELTNCRFWGAPGANDDSTLILSKVFKKKVGTMKHFYMLSEHEDFKIAIVNNRPAAKNVPCHFTTEMNRVNHIGELEGRFDFEYDISRMPYKDKWFINNRYFKHPVYDYIIWTLGDEKHRYGGLMVAREVFYLDRKALKIIDYIGDLELLSGISPALKGLLSDEGYEYIDLYCTGIPDEILYRAGFVLRDEKDPNTIPNHFEPFVQNNIEIQYNTSHESAIFFRGDSDRDRPYIWKLK